MRLTIIPLAALCAGCAQRRAAQDATTPTVHIQRAVLTGFGKDTVYMQEEGSSYFLVWMEFNGRSHEKWRSSSFPFPPPVRANLVLINHDTLPDLLWTLQYEGYLEGQVLLGGALRSRLVFATDENACSVPSLRDIDGDGLPDILDYQSYALKPAECQGDAYASVCQDALPTDWVRVFLQEGDSFVNDSAKAGQFYITMAQLYGRASAALRSSIDSGTGIAARSPRCNRRMVADLDSMAARAARIAGLHP